MNDLILVKQSDVNGILMDFYKGNSDAWVTRRQIGEALEYSNPQKAIDNIHQKNKKRLDQFSVTLSLRGADGKFYETTLYNRRGALEICRWSRQPKADIVIDKCWDIMESVLTKGFYINEAHPNVFEHLRATLGIEQANRFELVNENSLQVRHGFGFHDPDYICQFEAKEEIGMEPSRFMGALKRRGLIDWELTNYDGSYWKTKQRILMPVATEKGSKDALVQVARNHHLRKMTDISSLAFCVRVKRSEVLPD